MEAEQLNALTLGIDKLQRSARHTVPMFVIGILATVIAAGVALWYIVTLSAHLEEAHKALAQSKAQLEEAHAGLQVANEALERVRSSAGSAGNAQQIAAAIDDVATSQKDVSSALGSIQVAADKLPPATTPVQVAAVAPKGWFAVLGSYPLNAGGRAQAQAQIAKIQASGACAELWQTQISSNYAVVLGSSASRDVAAANVKRAQASGMARDAFAQRDRDWARVAQSPTC